MTTCSEILNDAIAYLSKDIQDFKFSSEIIISHVLKIKNYLDIYLELDKKITREEEKLIWELLEKRKRHYPIYYLIKEIHFYNADIEINENVLIPRPETEEMVAFIAKKLEKKNLKNKVLLDLCTGSGCIAIALKKKFNDLTVYAIDKSKKALALAEKNAKKNSVEINFLQGDILQPFDNKKADFIVCNPPYISKKEYDSLSVEVKNFEPKEALIAEDDGLYFYKNIATNLKKYINRPANIFFEIGYNQKEAIEKIFYNENYKEGKTYKDLSGKDRFFFLEVE